MNNQDTRQLSPTELKIIKLLKYENRLQFSYDDDIDQNTIDMLHSFIELKDHIEELYGDVYPHTLGLKD